MGDQPTTPELPEIPDDLTGMSDDDLAGLLASIGELAKPFAGIAAGDHTEESIAAVAALAAAAEPVTAELEVRTARAEGQAAATDAANALAAFSTDSEDDDADGDDQDDTDEDEPEGLTASGTPVIPRVADIRKGKTPKPPEAPAGITLSMVAAADVPGFSTGQELKSWAEAGQALENRHRAYNSKSTVRKAAPREIQVHEATNIPTDRSRLEVTRAHRIKKFTRHGGVQIRRHAPQGRHLDSTTGDQAMDILREVSNETAVFGGSAVDRMMADLKAGKSLVAAAGWGGQSTPIHDLAETETLDGILPLPGPTADRGGFLIPTDGGPDFSTIYTGIGNAGDTHLTEAEVISETAKVCLDIPTPGFTNVRLGVDYYCLTGSLLQRRGYPEVTARYHNGARVALEHKINQGAIAAMVAGSTNGGVIPPAYGDDAAASLLSAVEVAIVDADYRQRAAFNQSYEIPLPFWVLAQLRAALARRRGVDKLAVSDLEIGSWFAERNAVPRFVYDWQDAFSGLSGGPGGTTPITALPTTVTFMVYTAGTWVKPTLDVIDLDTIYDSTMLGTNQYTAAFAETGWAVMKMRPISRYYTATVDPAGGVIEPTSP